MIGGRVGEFSLWVSASQMTDIIFILTLGGRKNLVPATLEKLRRLRLFVNVLPVVAADIDRMLATEWPDPEDALLADLALKMKADAIITRDADFPRPDGVPVMDCDGFFNWMSDEFGIVYEEIPF